MIRHKSAATDAAGILYGDLGARGHASAVSELVRPKDWWPDQIDYSRVSTGGNICFLDLEGYSGHHTWGVRSASLPTELLSRLHVEEPPDMLIYQLSALRSRAADMDQYPRVTIGEKLGRSSYWLEIEGSDDTLMNAEANLLAFIEQQSMMDGEWVYAPGPGKNPVPTKAGQFILYVDAKPASSELLGWLKT